MKRRISKVILPGEMLPKYYGLAYRDFLHDIAICYPFPFNYVVHIVRRCWMRIRYPRLRDKYAEWANQRMAEEYEKGHKRGYEIGYNKGRDNGYKRGIADGTDAMKQRMRDEWERIKDE